MNEYISFLRCGISHSLRHDHDRKGGKRKARDCVQERGTGPDYTPISGHSVYVAIYCGVTLQGQSRAVYI